MGFLIRTALVVALLLLIIPLDVERETQGEPVGALQTFWAARNAVQDMAGLCERQPGVCETAGAALGTITARAKEVLRIAQEMMAEEAAGPEADAPPETAEEPAQI